MRIILIIKCVRLCVCVCDLFIKNDKANRTFYIKGEGKIFIIYKKNQIKYNRIRNIIFTR